MKYLSNRQQNLKVGISSYTENKTVLEVIGNTNISGIISAIGGFNLGISSAGTPITSGPITTLNFVGAGNTFAINGTTVDISIAGGEGGGGGASVSIGAEPPEDPNEGDLWYSSILGRTFIYYVDDDSSQWVDAAPFNQPFLDNVSGIGFSSGSASDPSIYSTDYPTTGLFFPSSTEITLVSSGSSILNVNSSGINVSGIITATSFSGSGANITSLNASNISSGTISDARLPDLITSNINITSGVSTFATVKATTFEGALTGTATSTTNIPNLTGDITSVNKATTLATVNSNVGTFGSGTAIPTITVNAKGLITGVTTTAVTSGTTITDDTSTNASRFLTFTSATSGSISAANVSSSKLTYNPSTGTVSATVFNATSDINLKENIKIIENPIEKVSQLNGVSFDWKDNHQSSAGVIAQDVEKVLPEIIRENDGSKSVNYNGLIGLLIEAIKEQQKQIDELKANQ